MAVNIGPRIGIDGEADFRKQLNNIIQQCKTLDSEMKSVTSSFDANDQSQEKLTQQSEVLTKQIQAQTQRLEMLQKGLAESANKYGDADTKTQKWQQAVNEATTTLNRMQRQLDDINSAMETNAFDDLTRQIEEQEAEVKRLRTAYQNAVLEFGDTSDEAEQLGRELSSASAELKQSRSAMRSAANAADELDNSLDDAADSADDLDSTFSRLGDVIGGNVIADGIQSIVGGMKDLYEESLEYRRIMASLETSSERMGYSAEQTAQSYDKLIGVLGDTQTAATTTSNLQALGLEQEQLNDLIDGAIGSWAAYGDSIPIDGLAESITETARVGEVTGTLADVLNWTAGEEESFNAELANTEDATDRANKIIQKLADYGLTDLGRQWQENNKDMMDYNQASDDLQGALADLGKTAGPVLTDLVEFLADFLELLNEVAPVIKDLTGSTQTLGAQLENLGFDDVADKLEYLNEEQQEQVLNMVNAESAGMNLQERLNLINTAIETVTSSTEANTTAQQKNATATDTASSSIGAEITAFSNLDAATRDRMVSIVNSMTEIQESISNAVQSQLDWFGAIDEEMGITADTVLQSMQTQMDAFNSWGENLADLANRTDVTINEGLLQYLANMGPEGAEYVAAFNQMTTEQLAQANSLWEESIDIQSMTSGWGEELKQGVGEIAAGGELDFMELSARWKSAMNTAGGDVTQGFADGIRIAADQATAAADELGQGVLDSLNNLFQFGSPSHVTTQEGQWVSEGFYNGIRENAAAVRAAGKEIAREALFGLRAVSVSDFQSVGLNLARGFANGISAGRSAVINASTSMAQAAINAARSTLDINSPSKVFQEIGAYTSEGFLLGMEGIDLKREVSRILDFQQQHVNAVMALQYQNVDEIYSVVYSAVKSGMQQVSDRDKRYMDILDNMSKRPVVTQNYMDGRPIGYGVAPYVTTKQQQDTKIKNWVNGVKS